MNAQDHAWGMLVCAPQNVDLLLSNRNDVDDHSRALNQLRSPVYHCRCASRTGVRICKSLLVADASSQNRSGVYSWRYALVCCGSDLRIDRQPACSIHCRRYGYASQIFLQFRVSRTVLTCSQVFHPTTLGHMLLADTVIHRKGSVSIWQV